MTWGVIDQAREGKNKLGELLREGVSKSELTSV